jgi:hypothetical protein
MHFPVIWCRLTSPYMTPRWLEGGVSPRLALPYHLKNYCLSVQTSMLFMYIDE